MFAQLILRSAPMKCLGGRSPYEVVTGLKPRFPGTLKTGVPVVARGVDAYVKGLLEHLRSVYSSVQRTTLEKIEKDETTLAGRIKAELVAGDAVLVRREATVERKGPTRFQERVYPGVYVIKRKISPTTFEVEDIVDKRSNVPFRQPLHAERLAMLDMPELDLRPDQPRRIRMRERVKHSLGMITRSNVSGQMGESTCVTQGEQQSGLT